MSPVRALLVLVLVSSFAACGPAGDDGRRELTARVEALERRLQQRPAAPATDDRQVENDLKALERRLAMLEAEVVGLIDGLAGEQVDEGGQPGGNEGAERLRRRRLRPRATREERRERRAKLRSLNTEYRDRLGNLRQQFSDDPRDPARQEALREILEWYRAQRLEILRGGDPG